MDHNLCIVQKLGRKCGEQCKHCLHGYWRHARKLTTQREKSEKREMRGRKKSHELMWHINQNWEKKRVRKKSQELMWHINQNCSFAGIICCMTPFVGWHHLHTAILASIIGWHQLLHRTISWHLWKDLTCNLIGICSRLSRLKLSFSTLIAAVSVTLIKEKSMWHWEAWGSIFVEALRWNPRHEILL